MRQALTLGLAGLLVLAPALQGQEPMLWRNAPETPLTRLALADSAWAARRAFRVASDDPSPHPRLGKMVTWGLIGAVAGGTIAYYTYKPTFNNCSGFQCYDVKKRTVEGALIGGTAGFALGALVTWGENRPKPVMR